MAHEINELAKFGLPCYTHPEVAIACLFDPFIDSKLEKRREEKRIPVTSTRHGIVSNRVYERDLILGPMESDLLPRSILSGGTVSPVPLGKI